ncbi:MULTISPECIES: sensor histidine kinase [Leptolyngbya]|uniref:sensor histidine kinase n=1 Tax=Leptolyngbya TaxID=47251 RepID=UPI0016869673|nr:ATP-binding protein [Leptolyngbya sp. FACHB-1624]MBD1854758.1 two-component sensor histidine kinase [Leptolyngbya sp. FACHB-1624]
MFTRSRRNLSRWFMLSMGSILMVFAVTRYYLTAIERLKYLDQLLYKKAQVVAATVQYKQRDGHRQIDFRNVPFLGESPLPPGSDAVYARWYDPQGRLQQFFGIASPPAMLEDVPELHTLTIDAGLLSGADGVVQSADQLMLVRQITLPVQYRGQMLGYLQVAVPLAPLQRELQQDLLISLISIQIALIVIVVTAWALSGVAMQPIQESYDHLQKFTADASHELRTPLAAILSNAQVGLLAPMEKGESKHQRLEKIAATAKSMTVLISNLLFLARRSGRITDEALQPTDLGRVLQELIKESTIRTVAQWVQLSLDLPERAVTIHAEPELLKQAIANLITNACKYTPADGTVNLRLFVQSRQAIVQVEDTGIGIPAEHLPHIFERFYRVDQDRSRDRGGTGLGLAIAQQIITAHGGTITARSSVGQGSVFQIVLPLQSSI